MSVFNGSLHIETSGRGVTNITHAVQAQVARSEVHSGVASVFVHHTSASLMLSENADPDVVRDLEAFMARLVPDGDPIYRHTAEGPDDMAAHIRSVLTQTDLTLPVRDGQCDLGTWQGVFLWEHRHHPHRRRLTVSVMGQPLP
jgi:secondary thiamine-phosphate synthase enzyme